MDRNSPVIVAPSLLAADWSRLKDEIEAVEAAGADWLHLDVMDGSFVPEISFGARFVETVAKIAKIPLDVHLMVQAPERHFERFIGAGAHRITFHQEATAHGHLLIQNIKKQGATAGIALNPGTSVAVIEPLLSDLDLLLLMTVNPGWGGQSFISSALAKIRDARTRMSATTRDIFLQVDGGVDPLTAAQCRNEGANCLVAGSAIFNKQSYSQAISEIRGAA